MLKLVIRPIPAIEESAVDPAYLVQNKGIRIGIYAGISKKTIGIYIFFVALAIYVCSPATVGFANALNPSRDGAFRVAALALCIGMSLVLLVLTRKIASAKVHFLPLGEVFPTINERARNMPKRGIKWWIRRLSPPASINRDFDFDLAVRMTEPNVGARLEKHMAHKKTVIDFDELSGGYDALMMSHFPSKKLLTKFASNQAHNSGQKSDLWPIARLTISRILYPGEKVTKALMPRSSEKIASKPPVKGAHYYLAFKLSLVPLALWFLLLPVVISLPRFAHLHPGKGATVFAASLILAWGIFTIVYARTTVTNWKQWLTESGNRPLGNLPIFLYLSHNDVQQKWEELDIHDFQVPIEEYLMDTQTTYQVVVGFFMGTAFSLSRLLV